MRQALFLILMMAVGCLAQSCSSESEAKPYETLSASEEARQALDDEDFARAIELYSALVASEPEAYIHYRFLSAAYAGSAGFDVLEIVINALSGSDSSNNLLEILGQFVPEDPTEEQVNHMQLAAQTVEAIPVVQRSRDHPEIEGASSAAQQLEIYQTGFAIISINRFTAVNSDGSFDPSKLATMTEDDAAAIVDNFEAVAASSGGIVSAGADKVLDQIRASPGTTTSEKLKSFIAARRGQITQSGRKALSLMAHEARECKTFSMKSCKTRISIAERPASRL